MKIEYWREEHKHLKTFHTDGRSLLFPLTVDIDKGEALCWHPGRHNRLVVKNGRLRTKIIKGDFKVVDINEGLEGKPSIKKFHNIANGRIAYILGSGPSLTTDILRVTQKGVQFCVNYMPLQFAPRPGFIVFADQPVDFQQEILANNPDIPRISVWGKHTSVALDVPYHHRNLSGGLATWAALYMGCDPVVLMGFDCYRGDKGYCTGAPRHQKMHDMPLAYHLNPWKLLKDDFGDDAGKVKAMSGPLMSIFGRYEE